MEDPKVIPQEMRLAMTHISTKKYWIGTGNDFTKCENCGGWGFLSLTVGISGPFNSPSGKGSTTSDKMNGHIVWFESVTGTYVCPVCEGGRKVREQPGVYDIGNVALKVGWGSMQGS